MPCPNCSGGHLRLDEKTFAFGETDESVRSHSHREFNPDWVVGRFVGLLRCQSCTETVAVSGKYLLEECYNEKWERDFEQVLVPRFFLSAPSIFPIPKNVPEEIGAEVRKAFELYWSDTSASANRIRTTIEMLLTHLGVPRYTINKQHKRETLSLSSRIDKLKVRKPNLSNEFVNALTAVRHLGNAGSHSEGLTRDDLLDAMEILDHMIQEMFIQPTKRLAEMTRQINRRKAPRSR